jgi:hypothetical protein
MKNVLFYGTKVFLLILGSCSKIENVVPEESGGTMIFKGIEVPIPLGVSKEVFKREESDFQKKFFATLPKARTSGEKVAYSLSDFIKFSSPIVDKYPNRSNLVKDPKMAEKLKKDFSYFSEEQLEKHLDVILKYYNQIVAYELLKVLPNMPKTFVKKSSKVTSGYFGTVLNSCEFWDIFWNSGKKGAVERATNNALSWAEQDFPTSTSQGRGDAFRHSLWNALIIQELSDENYPTYEVLPFTADFTTDHECDTQDEFDKNMDLHNNSVGLNYYPSLTTYRYKWTGCGFLCWGRIPIFNNPGYSTLRNFYKNLANNSCNQVFNSTDIQNTNLNTLVRIL